MSMYLQHIDVTHLLIEGISGLCLNNDEITSPVFFFSGGPFRLASELTFFTVDSGLAASSFSSVLLRLSGSCSLVATA